MKGLNFLVLQFSLLPLVTGVYKFQVLVSFPSLHWRILTRGLDQHGGVGVSSEGGFVFNVPVWLIDHVPKNDLKVLTNSKYPTECTDFRRFFTIYSFFGSRLYYGRTRDICGKMPQNVKKRVQFGSPILLKGLNDVCFEVGKFFQGLLPVPCFLWKMPFEMPIFCLSKLINSCQDWELFVQELWNGLKLYSQTSTVFQKNAIKMKMLFSRQPNELGFWCIQNWCTQILNFSGAPGQKCLCAPRA